MIPVFEPIIGDEEVQAVVAALRRGEISGTYGKTIEHFEEAFAAYCGCNYGVAVTSGTAALHLAVAAAGIGPGDEVLVSACTNIATALAVVHCNAIPVPVDSEETTWNLDLNLLESLVTPRTRAIMPVHLYGHPVDMPRLIEVARRFNLIVIEDCAEAHGAACYGKKVGSFGNMACFSFYANKVITTGEGGMVTTNDPALADRLRLLRNLGFTKPRFRHEFAGYNFRMTGLQAAMGLVQLGKIDQIIAEKRRVAACYTRYLAHVPGLQLPCQLDWAFNIYWVYALVVGDEYGMTRDRLVEVLQSQGVETRTFFCPMNQQPCLISRHGFRSIPCPVADRLWQRGLYLPSSPALTEEMISSVADCIRGAPVAV